MDLFDPAIHINIYLLGTIFLIMYIVIFHLDEFLNEKKLKQVHNFTEECVVGCKNYCEECKVVNNWRDKGYYLFEADDKGQCLITRWEISHLLFHIFLGYYTNIYISQSLSVGFEIFEHYKFDCGSYIDLVYNLSGFLIGKGLRNWKYK
jgi:hypothetical protein